MNSFRLGRVAVLLVATVVVALVPAVALAQQQGGDGGTLYSRSARHDRA
jgi:hypothetical protein